MRDTTGRGDRETVEEMDDRRFLESQASLVLHLDHPPEECEQCRIRKIYAEVAQKMLDDGETGEGAILKWASRVTSAAHGIDKTR